MADMFDMFDDDLDFDKPSSGGADFAQFPDGKYPVTRISKFIGLVEDEFGVKNPTFQEDNFGNRVVKFKWLLESGEEGPPESATLGRLSSILRNLGYAVTNLPAGDEKSYLDLALSLAPTTAPPDLAVNVKNGWVNYHSWNNSPKLSTFYQFKVVGFLNNFRRRSEIIRFEKGEYGKQLFVLLEIMGDMNGNPTIYNGLVMQVPMYDPFADNHPDYEKQVWVFRKGADGKPLTATRALGMFLKSFAPNCFPDRSNPTKKTRGIFIDPAQSPLGVNELEEPMHVFAQESLSQGRRCIGMVSLTKGGNPKIDMENIVPVEGYAPFEVEEIPEFVTPTEDQPVPEDSLDASPLEELIHLITECADSPVFEDTSTSENIRFTESGKAWMKKNIIPIWDTLPDFPTQRHLGLLTVPQVSQLYVRIETDIVMDRPDTPWTDANADSVF